MASFGPVDHLVYGAPELGAACAELERLLGVRPAAGGVHEGLGTHNALLGLGGGAYLEVIAPDPGQPAPDVPRHQGLDALPAPRLVGWAAKATGLEARVASSRAAGYDPGPAVPMSRRRPDAVLLEWRLTVLGREPAGGGLAPFLIDWGAAAHPAETAPGGCRLTGLRGEHPEPASVEAMLSALGVSLAVSWGERAVLVATIEARGGTVELR